MSGPMGIRRLHHDGLSRPLVDARLRVLSLGAGVQSTTVALMAARGELGAQPDCAIFADTGAEPQAVYRHLEWLRSVLPFEVHIVSAGDLRQELLDASAGVRGSWGRPPLFVRGDDGQVGMTRRQCTQDYKLEPIIKKVRELIGLAPRQRGPKKPVVEQWIGISTDEIIRLKPSRHSYIQNRHPLIEARMSRQACLDWLHQRQYPRPPKSACTFCPYHSNEMWREMRDSDPTSWSDAVRVDGALRSGQHILLKGTPYLHRSCQPLDRVDFTRAEERCGQPSFLEECEGMCGV